MTIEISADDQAFIVECIDAKIASLQALKAKLQAPATPATVDTGNEG